jgi:two-component system response regulator DegU
MKNKKIKVFIADDHEIFRDGVKQLISNEADMEVSGTASSGEEALAMIVENIPDIVIMDIRMPGLNGLETSKAILKTAKDIHIIIFSLYDREDYVANALEMGAHGYILKDTSNKIFLNGIRAVHSGQYYFTGEVSDVIVRKYKAMKEERYVNDPPPAYASPSLSKRELEIVHMIRMGNTNKDIAEAFGLSVRTIEAHRMNILRKFKANNFDEVLKSAEKYQEE